MAPNLNRNEKLVVAEFTGHEPGAWLSRKWLVNDLCDALHAMNERTLDTVLVRLMEWGLIVRIPTDDRGAMYALASTQEEFPQLKEFARECHSKSRRCSAQAIPVEHGPGEVFYVPMATEFGDPFISHGHDDSDDGQRKKKAV